MDYIEARNYIRKLEKLGSDFGLDAIRELLGRLDNPENCAPAIHIAGTNGKGSIMAFIEETFVKCGMTVGRYISPTIFDYRERWRRNKEWADGADVALAVTAVKAEIDAMVAEKGFRDNWQGQGVNYISDRLALEDMHPANVFIDELTGKPTCIDCIVKFLKP